MHSFLKEIRIDDGPLQGSHVEYWKQFRVLDELDCFLDLTEWDVNEMQGMKIGLDGDDR